MASKTKIYMTFGLLILAVIAAALVAPLFGYGAQKQQAVPTGTTPPAGTEVPAGTDSFAPTEVDVRLYDARYPANAISDTSVTGVVYALGTSDETMRDADAPTINTGDAVSATGLVQFTSGNGLMYTGATYDMKFYDNAASPAYYAERKSIKVQTRNPELGTGAIGTDPERVSLQAIGTITDPMTDNATSSSDGALPTGVTSNDATNTVTINKTAITTSTVTFKYTLKFANTVDGTYLKNMVIDPAVGSTIPGSAFSSALLSHSTGTVLTPTGSVLNKIKNNNPISLGTFNENTGTSTYTLTLGIVNASISNGQSFVLYVDDLDSHSGKDPLTDGVGAATANVTIAVTQ